MEELRENVNMLKAGIDALVANESQIQADIKELSYSMKELARSINGLKDAFPGGDLAGHKQAHELMMEEVRDRKRLIQAIKEKTLAALVWSVMAGIAVAVWSYFNSHIASLR